jgi:hypothetical protein
VDTNLPIHIAPWLRTPQAVIAISVCVASAAFSAYILTRKSLSAEERERARRDQLARSGRITDGSITDTQWIPSRTESGSNTPSGTPSLLLYQYEIAGVVYECAQDVSSVPELVRQIRIDLPVQIRFDPRNPANSIVVAESWTGLRLGATPESATTDHLTVEQPAAPVQATTPENHSAEHTHA